MAKQFIKVNGELIPKYRKCGACNAKLLWAMNYCPACRTGKTIADINKTRADETYYRQLEKEYKEELKKGCV